MIDSILFNKVLQIIADLEKEADSKRIVEDTVAKFGQLDVVVTSAGILVTGSLEQLSIEDYDRQMNINTRSVFLTLKSAIPHLRKTKGNIVNVSSVTGPRSFPGVISYCMSKAALDQLTKCLALEVAPDIRVNAVNPGVIVTNCHKEAGMDEEAYQKFVRKF
jgi:NAD(P)-dependent dehydrogenase (short-subunit alcohol dehydrogenase family)